MPIFTEGEMQRLRRRAAADAADADLHAQLQTSAEDDLRRQREHDDWVILEASQITPMSKWEQVASWVSDEVWERILNDMPVSRPKLETIRPSKNARRLTDDPAA